MGLIRDIRKNPFIYLLGLPGLIFITVFSIVPITGHILAFKNYRLSEGIWGSKWCGLENFKFFFMGKDWLTVTFNTLFLNALFIVSTLTIAVIMSVFLNEMRSRFVKKVVQSLVFLPYFVSWLVVSMMVYAMLNQTDGLINSILSGLGRDKIGFYQNAELWPFLLTIFYVWKFAGYYSIIFIASIVSISPEYYESARMDGATRFQQILYITLPLIKNTFITLLLLSIGRIFFGDFGMIYSIIGDNGILFPTTDIIDTYSFRALRQMGNFGMASAVSLYQSVMGLLVILVFNKIVKKYSIENAMF
ncbi:putative aldouronate transport system permease protein [Hungatella effluvii]|uniref:Putative aldouronate transport system permease protein n=1 Tax=Hungatella effluvii TaxID=1096246 RepID=A0A2V3YE53_9FIRM|nr:ABC transporter permease subunit [Hungatella effluvii]PXX57093.1 putative aldouronate transport system permease protein [Hungatella effluvii]